MENIDKTYEVIEERLLQIKELTRKIDGVRDDINIINNAQTVRCIKFYRKTDDYMDDIYVNEDISQTIIDFLLKSYTDEYNELVNKMKEIDLNVTIDDDPTIDATLPGDLL